MWVTLRTILGIKQAIGHGTMEIELAPGSTVGDLLTYLKERWGDRLLTHVFDPGGGAVLPYVRIMVNGRAIEFLQGAATLLKEGDEVLILPPVSGG